MVWEGPTRPCQQSDHLSTFPLPRNHHTKLRTNSLFLSELFIEILSHSQGSRTAPLATVCSRPTNFYRKGRFRIMLYRSSRGILPGSLVCITAMIRPTNSARNISLLFAWARGARNERLTCPLNELPEAHLDESTQISGVRCTPRCYLKNQQRSTSQSQLVRWFCSSSFPSCRHHHR
jgi:hypothetical protein